MSIALPQIIDNTLDDPRHRSQLIVGAPADWQSGPGKLWLRLHAGRIDDIRAALDWSFSQGGDLPLGLRLVAASGRLWFQLSLT